jgi:hypothetical protein
MATRLNDALRNVIGDAIRAEYAGGTLTLRTGAQPATAGTAASGTVFAAITLPSPAFGASSSGTISKSGTWQATASNTVDVSPGAGGFYARFVSASGDRRLDLAGHAEITIDNNNIVTGGTVTVSTATVTMPAG